MAEYTFHLLQEGDFEKLIPLFKDCFGVDLNLDYYVWKFLKNPAGQMHGYYALSAEGEVAAYYGVIPERYIIDGRERLIYQSGDTMTHSKHRRKGLFFNLAQKCYNDLASKGELFVLGFPGEKSTPGLVKLGWHHLFNMRHYIYVGQLAFFRINRNVEGVEEIKDPKLLCQIAQRSEQTNVRVDKRPEQFLWRVSNPRYHYHFIAFKENGSKDYSGYAVYYLHQNKIIILDFYADTKKGYDKLFCKLKNITEERKLRGIVHFCQVSSTYAGILKRHWFVTNPFRKGPISFRVPFMLLCDEQTYQQYKDSNNWNLNSYDHDAH